jgi:hypothetical protein
MAFYIVLLFARLHWAAGQVHDYTPDSKPTQEKRLALRKAQASHPMNGDTIRPQGFRTSINQYEPILVEATVITGKKMTNQIEHPFPNGLFCSGPGARSTMRDPA